MDFWSTTSGPLIYAHRGANLEFPENGIEAFRRALELGADVLELDIHASRDGVFVVSHDATGERSAGMRRRIEECDWAEVSTWDAGWGFVDAAGAYPFRGQGMRFARLETVLDSFATTPLNVDVKGVRPDQLRLLLSLIRAARAEERVLLTSFSRHCVVAIEGLGYGGAIGLSRHDVARLLFSPERLSRWLGFRGCRVQIPLRSGPFELGRRAFIERCHRLGLGVDYWVVNDAELASELLDRGADGIVTDDPATIADLFRRSPKAPAWRARHAQSSLESL
jgi:glycerophosphoryl diester phosphodiesterase